MDKFTIEGAVRYGWEAFKANAIVLIGVFVIISAISSIPNIYVQFAGEKSVTSPLYFILTIVVWAVTMLASCGMIRITLDIYNGQEGDFEDLFTTVEPFLSYLLGSLLLGVILTIGFILLIIPGIYLSIRFCMFPFAVVDEGLGPIEALKRSWELTAGQELNLLLLGLVFILIEIAGLIALCVGIFVAMPVIMMGYVYVYRQLQGKAGMAY